MGELDFWHWWGIAAALGALDMLARRGDFLCAGVAALVVGLVLFAVPGLSWPGQLLIFAGAGLVVVLASRGLARRSGAAQDETPAGDDGRQHIGRILVLEQPIIGGQGSVVIDGVRWPLEGADLPAGARVSVVDSDGDVLKVKRY